MKKILIVDDEPAVLRSLKRAFRSTKYEIAFVQTGEEALALLKEEPFHMVLSDVRMPGMDGFELLKQIRQIDETILRVILSGYNEESEMVHSVLEGDVHSYLTKPWDNEELIDHINHLFSLYETLSQSNLKEIIDRCSKLPVLSSTFQKVSKLLETDHSIAELEEVIMESPELCAEFLHIANSAFYSAKTADLKRALVAIGENAIKEVLLLIDISSLMPASDTHVRMLLDHVVTTNNNFHSLYRMKFKTSVPHEISSAGLLHDLGSFIYLANFEDNYRKALQMTPSESDLVEVERELFTISHELLSAYMLDWWNFPFRLVSLVISHHTPVPFNDSHWQEIALLQLADYFSSPARSTFSEEYIQSLLDSLDLSYEKVHNAMLVAQGV